MDSNSLVDGLRMLRGAEIALQASGREALEERHGQVWDTSQLSDEFRVVGFAAPFVVVRRISTGEQGSLEFQHNPRFYFNWVKD